MVTTRATRGRLQCTLSFPLSFWFVRASKYSWESPHPTVFGTLLYTGRTPLDVGYHSLFAFICCLMQTGSQTGVLHLQPVYRIQGVERCETHLTAFPLFRPWGSESMFTEGKDNLMEEKHTFLGSSCFFAGFMCSTGPNFCYMSWLGFVYHES